MKKLNYRHFIWIGAIAISLALIPFCFQYAHLRIAEACVDLYNSAKYYISELLNLGWTGEITVNNFTGQPFNLPLNLPRTWDEFCDNMSGYWSLFFSAENFSSYLVKVSDVLLLITKLLMIVTPMFLIFYVVLAIKKPKINNDYGKESKPLKAFKRFEKKVFPPVKSWLSDFIQFSREHSFYIKILVFIWVYNFNGVSIIISAIAYYLYFIAALKTSTIYVQIVKLLMDLSVMIDFIPGPLWVVIIIALLNLLARHIGFNRLYHHERCNRGFINERGISSTIDGSMGKGKTMLISDMALSGEVQLRDQALEVILESDYKFPYFPWQNLELFLKRMFRKHRIYDVWSCRRVIKSKRLKFERKPLNRYIFGYDFNYYGLEYNDKLKLTNVWVAIEDYACAYLIYTRQCALLVSNYSIRSDVIIDDLGNFPLADSDFFKRDSRFLESFSRHSHILDYDMLRLGKAMIEDNPNRYAFGFGVYVISEIDKERKNVNATKHMKPTDAECNQVNDLFNLNLMMSRHAVTIAHRCFLIVLSDLQRFEELGIGTLGLGERVSIEKKSDMSPVLPFFSTFWLTDLVFGFIINKFNRHYIKYRHDRADGTLFMYLYKKFVTMLVHHRERVSNLFGCSVISLNVASGSGDEEGEKRKYYLQSKKIWADRYSTDCLSGIYEARSVFNKIGIDDITEYDSLMASNDELQKQHSHFQNDISNMTKAQS